MKFLLVIICLFGLKSQAQVLGCTDPLSKNYNPNATQNDGSCIYATKSIKPIKSFELPENVKETSGLFFWNDTLWTHNDDKDFGIYGFEISKTDSITKQNLSNIKKHNLTKITDWEATSQDEKYIYVGDFGNNYKGNRQNLSIKKILKSSIIEGNLQMASIDFTYDNQTDFNSQKPNKTNFDCEAVITKGDSLYLFTKQWNNKKTAVYSLSKQSGKQTAKKITEFDVDGLITDAMYLENKNLLVLCGYSDTIKPFIYLFYDFKGTDFFSGNKRKIKLNLNFHQIEGITTTDGLIYYLTNEKLYHLNGIIDVKPKLHVLDLCDFLKDYISTFDSKLSIENTEEIPINVEFENEIKNEITNPSSNKTTTTKN